MGGKGAQPQNNQMVNFEMEQAAKADAKEQERKARLEQGVKGISQIFHGNEIMKSTPAKLSGLSALNVQLGGQRGDTTPFGTAPTKFDAVPGYDANGQWSDIGDTGWKVGAANNGYVAYDPEGHARGVGADWNQLAGQLEGADYNKMAGTGEFDADPFGDIKSNYKTSLTDLHSKNLNTTYNKALDEALFATARAGQRGSTTSRDILADIGGRKYEPQSDGTFKAIDYGQYGEAKNKMTSDVDKSLSDLNSQIQSAQDSAENQLYMTEDPGQALTEAHKLAGNIPAVPQYNTLGDLFKPLVIGATGFYSGYQGQDAFNQGFATPKSSLSKGSGQETK